MTSQYPTPPPTGSPKHFSSYPSGPPQDTYYLPPRPSTQYANFNDSSYLPAQEDYYHDTYPPRLESAYPDNGYPSGVKPPRRPSSADGMSPNTSPKITYGRPTKGRRWPKPFFTSPTNPSPSPYNASRPAPRPGFLGRIIYKLREWARALKSWAKRNPIKVGLLGFVPVIFGGIALWKLGKGVVKGVKGVARGVKGLWNGEYGKMNGKWTYGLEDFEGFAGSKGGPLDGFLKVMQMLMNHWCKLDPSSVPRLFSILLELYFLEAWQKKESREHDDASDTDDD